MSGFDKKTYSDSYLYNKEANKHNQNLTEYILKADRIDKNSQAFGSIIDNVKRQQNSSILFSVLMNRDVIICINTVELPRAFKVFEAKDIKNNIGGNSNETKVFIDVTGLIVFKDGYYICKKIDVLITYIFDALVYLLYSKSGTKMVNNSSITISSTECFVSMVDYILDYLRIIGFSNNLSYRFILSLSSDG